MNHHKIDVDFQSICFMHEEGYGKIHMKSAFQLASEKYNYELKAIIESKTKKKIARFKADFEHRAN